MLEAMRQTRISTGWGIDEAACAVFENEKFAGVIGKGMYEITMTNFETKDHRITEKTKA
jgi:cyanophycinase-like exopeptidase